MQFCVMLLTMALSSDGMFHSQTFQIKKRLFFGGNPGCAGGRGVGWSSELDSSAVRLMITFFFLFIFVSLFTLNLFGLNLLKKMLYSLEDIKGIGRRMGEREMVFCLFRARESQLQMRTGERVDFFLWLYI